jgi:hypothetical protein
MAREIGALRWIEIALGRASTGEAVERLVSGLALDASHQYDPFAQLRHTSGCGQEGKTTATTWHAPSAELCEALLWRSNVAARLKDRPKQVKEEEGNAKSCVLQ